MLTASLCVVALNEEKFINNLLSDLAKQTYPHELLEIILIDGFSSDKTKSIMERFKEVTTGFKNIKVLDNPKVIQAAGWNVAIKNVECDVIFRIDAHTHIPSDFVEKNMKLQEEGEYITGGVRPCVIENPTLWSKMLLEVENSLFGSGINKSRHEVNEKCYVKTIFHAAYRKEVFEKVGLFNENLLRTEDNEMHYRLRQAGYKFCFDPSIVSYQYARNSLPKMIKQKYGNGFWIGKTVKICPKCMSWYHFIPFVFVLGIIFTSIFSMFHINFLSIVMWSAYLLFTIVSTVISLVNKKGNVFSIFMPVIFLILHISYGIGTIIGLIKK